MPSLHATVETDSANLAEYLQRVGPTGWVNASPNGVYDLAIVGAGPAGLAAAEAASRLGLRVALLESNKLGGNSLNAGSIPSKAVIRVARVYGEMREADAFIAMQPKGTETEFRSVMARMRRIRTRIAEYNSVVRLQAKGIEIFFGEAKFRSSNVLSIDGAELKFRKALIATGARPRPSNIPGLEEVGYQTSATIFDIDALPGRIAVIGGGPLGCELAQAFCRLGSHVTIAQNDPKFLPREERDAADLLSRSLARDGVVIRLNTTVVGARLENGMKVLDTVDDDVQGVISADEILLSIGRIPNVESLNLAAAGIACDSSHNIEVDEFLRTTNKRVYAAGDACMADKFTNVAEASARMAVQNAFLGGRHPRSDLIVPWCTFCDPEIAHVGLHAWQANQSSIPVKSVTVMMQDVDRAITDRQDDGFVKIHVRDGTDHILGATIVASRASEMINEVAVAMTAGIGLRDLADVLHVYPAQSEAIKLAGLAFKRDEPVSWLERAFARFLA